MSACSHHRVDDKYVGSHVGSEECVVDGEGAVEIAPFLSKGDYEGVGAKRVRSLSIELQRCVDVVMVTEELDACPTSLRFMFIFAFRCRPRPICVVARSTHVQGRGSKMGVTQECEREKVFTLMLNKFGR